MIGLLRHTRVRLTAAYAGVLLLLATGGGVAFWLVLQSENYNRIDTVMRADARDAASNAQDSAADGTPLVLEDAVDGLPADISLLTHDGRVVVSLGVGLTVDADRLAVAEHGRAEAQWIGNMRSGALDERVLVGPVARVPALLVMVSYPLTELEHQLGDVAMLLGELVLVFVVLTSVLGYALAERTLKPVGVIAGLARDLSEHDLHRRIDLSLPPDELGELAATFNAMLARLERAFLALRHFTADAAHELRAPLTLMRAELEAALSRGVECVDPAVVRALVAETDRLSRLADQLLLMVQADSGQLATERAVVDVADLVVERGDRWRPAAAAKGVRLVVQAPESGTLLADAGLLTRLIDNLLDNAIRHTPRGGEVALAARRTDDGWEVSVADTGPGIPPSLRPRLFERFARADSSRSRQSGGAGLGLSLCAAIASAHGGSVQLDEGTVTGTRFTVRLPD